MQTAARVASCQSGRPDASKLRFRLHTKACPQLVVLHVLLLRTTYSWHALAYASANLSSNFPWVKAAVYMFRSRSWRLPKATRACLEGARSAALSRKESRLPFALTAFQNRQQDLSE